MKHIQANKQSFVPRIIQTIMGVITLVIAHIIGTNVKKVLYRRGNADLKDIKNNPVDHSKKDKNAQVKQVKIVYITLARIIYISIMVIAFFIVLKLFGIETASLIAVLGTVGFTIGLALQGSLSDMASGILMALLQTYSIGDVIEIDGQHGRVSDFNIFNTTLIDSSSNADITIPNSLIQKSVVINHTKREKVIIVIDMLVANKNKDFATIKKIILDAVTKSPYILPKPKPSVEVHSIQIGTIMRLKVAIPSDKFPEEVDPIKTLIRQALAENIIEMVDKA